MLNIDIQKAKEEFIKYINNYDLQEKHLNRKMHHSFRVMEISSKLATEEGFSNEEIQLAILIGLLHDIARFKQYSEYNTFSDIQSFDHGDIGVQILEQNDYLRKFIQTDKYDDIIKIAIKNHNKFAIEEGLTEEQIKFSKLIRDADKIDILFEAIENFLNDESQDMENSKITPEVKKDFDEEKLLRREKYKKIAKADRVIQFLGFIFDINYKSSFKMIRDKRYIDKIANKFKFNDEYTQKAISSAREKANNYIAKKIQQ